MADKELLATLWVIMSSLIAFACGGWVAARTARPGTPGMVSGFMVGATTITLIVIVGITASPLPQMVDLRSVGIELGILPTPELLPPVREALDGLSEDASVPAEEVVEDGPSPAVVAQARTGAWYALSVLAALLIAGFLGGIAGDRTDLRSPPGPRAAVVSFIGVMALLAALTVWLWPDVRATALALTDMDQSAGPDAGVNLTEVARHPDAMWGETVTISGLVDRMLDSRSLLLGNDTPFVGDKVLVLGEEPLAELVTSAGVIVEGKVAQVTGEVHPLADIAAERIPVGLAGYDGQAVLMARQITLDVPVAGAAGDKEFAAGSDGPERGVTVTDVLDHPERYLGQTIIVSAEVEEQFLTPHTFTLGDRGFLAVSAEPHPELFVEATAFISGEVRRFALEDLERELGIDLDEATLRQYEGKPVIVVEAVEMVK